MASRRQVGEARTYSDEERVAILRDAQDCGVAEAARKHGVPRGTVSFWHWREQQVRAVGPWYRDGARVAGACGPRGAAAARGGRSAGEQTDGGAVRSAGRLEDERTARRAQLHAEREGAGARARRGARCERGRREVRGQPLHDLRLAAQAREGRREDPAAVLVDSRLPSGTSFVQQRIDNRSYKLHEFDQGDEPAMSQRRHMITSPGRPHELAFFELHPNPLRVRVPGASCLRVCMYEPIEPDEMETVLASVQEFCDTERIEPAYWIVEIDHRLPDASIVECGLRPFRKTVTIEYADSRLAPIDPDIARRFVRVSRDRPDSLEAYLRTMVTCLSGGIDPYLAATSRALGRALGDSPWKDAAALGGLGIQFGALGDEDEEYVYVLDGRSVGYTTLLDDRVSGSGCLPEVRGPRRDGLVGMHLHRFAIHRMAERGVSGPTATINVRNAGSAAIARRLGGVEVARTSEYTNLSEEALEPIE